MSIEPIAQAAISRFRDRIEEQGVIIKLEPNMPMAYGQGIWVEEVFANLISNALKYMRADNTAPKIIIRGYKQDDMAVYEVEDNGMGIAEEDQHQLFEMFSRVHNKQTQDIQGAGLGLSIVNRVVSKLGGEVGIRSIVNQGSIFWFSLPIKAKEMIMTLGQSLQNLAQEVKNEDTPENGEKSCE